MSDATERRERLKRVYEEASGCTACLLHQTRTNVVFGAGNADADLMFVGEGPGANEDRQGLPFVGRAGRLLDQLLEEIGLDRSEVFIANTVKCLRYTTRVQLADGSWERIGRLVRSRYSGEVMAVAEDGSLVARQVIGWHATPLAGRRVFKLTYRSSKAAGTHRVCTELTGDHPVLTKRGYVAAEDLTRGDRVAIGQGLSELAHDVVCGTLLGDGHLARKSSELQFGHSARQVEYARFKSQLLQELNPTLVERRVAAVSGGPSAYEVVHVRTRADRALRTLRADFYADRKRVPRWIADALSPRMLAFWFMDDGHLRVRGGGRRPCAEIASVSFDDADLQVLLTGLARLGLSAKALRGRLHFGVDASEKLSELIAPFVPAMMRYKLHPEVEGRVPFDPHRFARGPAKVMYDEVEIEEVTDEPRADTTFFCIDVAETHNFVTAGGVVHNCRPPGNRDPHPNEIESCHHFLRSQVELIEPKVICTLGNFATKLLRADPTGISRLHGQDEVRTIGARAIRLLPLFHPAAALYTPSTLDTLRADFARIPGLLALDAPPQPVPSEAVADMADTAPGPEAERAPAPERAPGDPESAPEPGSPPRRASDLPERPGNGAAGIESQGQVKPEPYPEQLGLF